jgi:hypothetical protein
MSCVCKPGNPCLFHYGLVRDGARKPSEVPHPENYRLAGLPRRALSLRERLARLLAPWAFDGPSWALNEESRAELEEGRSG